MLVFLRIKNLALVDEISLEFERGFNVLTGETGAGKSVVMGALNLLLGQRADKSLIRSGCGECRVEAAFEISGLIDALKDCFEENGLEELQSDQLVMVRQISANGVNKQFVNGSPTTLQVLGRIGDLLVDMHGPHDHQSLLHPPRQLRILDAFSQLDEERERFRNLMLKRSGVLKRISSLRVDPGEISRRLDLLRHQAGEIESANIQVDQDTDLESDFDRLQNASRLVEICGRALGALNEEEDNLMDRAGSLGRCLHELVRLDPTTQTIRDLHDQALDVWHELVRELSRYRDRVDLDPDVFGQMASRMDLLNGLKRKYGPELSDVLSHLESCRQEIQQWEDRETTLQALEASLFDWEGQILKQGGILTRKRGSAIPKLCGMVENQLKDLGFRQGKFRVRLETSATLDEVRQDNGSGLDRVEFEFAPNPGEPFMPLRQIASSGEIARVMLALKTVLAAADSIPVLVFDEVDANVGGETAAMVGRKLKTVAESRQVFCITHLAPVASMAGVHYRVEKQVLDGRTLTRIKRLDSAERVEEVARMLGGKQQKVVDHARMLLEKALEPLPDGGKRKPSD